MVKDRPAARASRASIRAAVLRGAALGLAVVCAACAREDANDPWALCQRFLGARAIEFRCPSGPLEPRAHLLARALAQQESLDVRVVAGEDWSDPNVPRVVFGTVRDPRVEPVAVALGIRPLAPRGFAWLGREHRHPSDAIVACAEDPERPGLPVVLVLGNDASALARVVRELPAPWKPRFRTFKHGEPAVDVAATFDGSPVLSTLVDRASERARLARDLTERTLEGIRFHVPPGMDEERLQAYAESCARAARRVGGWLGAKAGGVLPDVVVYTHPEDLERALGDCPLAWANPLGSRVHALLADGVPDDGGAALARAVAVELAGEPADPWILEGTGVAAARSWWGRPLVDWLAHLKRAGALSGAEDALWTSEHARAPARAARFLELAALGPEAIGAAWKRDGKAEVERRADRAADSARSTSASSDELAPGATSERPRAVLSGWRGLALEDAGASGLASSYAARAADERLGLVRELGANAVSYRVEATLEPLRPAVARLDEPAVHGSAADAVLVHAISRARSLGLATLCVVQPLGTPAGTRADAFGLIDPQDQRAFFGRFERIGVHYACLAELAGVDVLCLGEGLDSAACSAGLAPESRRLRKEDWRSAWTRLRPLFGGSWTYASSSLAAAREVEFWDALDLVALDSWPAFPAPLATSEPADLARLLRAEIEGARELGASAGRDVLWIQAGFPARDSAWQSSRVPRGAADPESQRRFFAGLRLVLDEGVAPPFAGFLVWNVPAASGGSAGGPYSVLGRPAEAEIPGLLGAP